MLVFIPSPRREHRETWGTCCGLKFLSNACFIPAERLWSNFGAEDELQDSEEPPESKPSGTKKNNKKKPNDTKTRTINWRSFISILPGIQGALVKRKQITYRTISTIYALACLTNVVCSAHSETNWHFCRLLLEARRANGTIQWPHS